MMITYRTTTTGATYADAEQQAHAQAGAFFGEDLPFHATSAHAVQQTVRHGTYADRCVTVPTSVEVEWEFRVVTSREPGDHDATPEEPTT